MGLPKEGIWGKLKQIFCRLDALPIAWRKVDHNTEGTSLNTKFHDISFYNGLIFRPTSAFFCMYVFLSVSVCLFGRPYYRSNLWYSVSSVCLSVCNVLHCGETVRPSEKVSEGVNRKLGSKSWFFGSPPYFYFRFRRYGHQDGRFCLIFARIAQQSVLDGKNWLSSSKPCAYCRIVWS